VKDRVAWSVIPTSTAIPVQYKMEYGCVLWMSFIFFYVVVCETWKINMMLLTYMFMYYVIAIFVVTYLLFGV
jgi:hypothetical protein